MPTARELLEQADALMRRKQEANAPRGEISQAQHGPSTDSTFAPTHGPQTVERADVPEPSPVLHFGLAGSAEESGRPAGAAAALSAMRWAAPAAPAGRSTTSPVFAPPPATSPRTIQREPIAPSVARTALPVDPTEPPAFVAPTRFVPPTPSRPAELDIPTLTDAVDAAALDAQAGDDVPLLTDAVDPLADEPILEDLDEPSVWSPTIGGATTVRVGTPAPDAVPAAPAEPPAGRDPLGLDLPPPGFVPAPAAQWSDAEPAPSQADAAAPAAESTVADAAIADEVVAEAAVAEEAIAEEAIAEEVIAEEPESESAAATTTEVADAVPESLLPEAAPAPPPQVVLAPLDDARVREIAEEIGMQVLQRIDIFTDTELRTRLGERLKPVVDRVSADLVTAINEHVGELLRAYVAEAIEREIDGWRDRQS